MVKKITLLVLMGFGLVGCDNNSKPVYGDTGLPKNCRAIVQANIDSYRNHQYSANDVMDSLERNCGANGYSWNN